MQRSHFMSKKQETQEISEALLEISWVFALQNRPLHEIEASVVGKIQMLSTMLPKFQINV